MTRTLVLADGTPSRDALIAALEPAGAMLLALGERLLAADGSAVDPTGLAILPGVLAAIDDASGRQIGNLESMLSDAGTARQRLAAALAVDEVTLDDDVIADVLGWLVSIDPQFEAESETPVAVGAPWAFAGSCLVDESPPVQPPDSPLRAARFAGDAVLEACLAGTHRMQAPEQGRAVLKIQAALLDLGFTLPVHGADGIFGDETGQAVSAFKEQNGLFPADPVVGHGTMQRLDDIFA